MKLSTIVAIVAAGALLAGALAASAHGGWFGLGGSDKPSDSSKSKTASSNSAKTPKASSAASNSSGKNLFGGIGGASAGSKSDPKKKTGLYASKQKTPDKKTGSSWWNSWMKPKQPPAPKTTSDWMKLQQVHY